MEARQCKLVAEGQRTTKEEFKREVSKHLTGKENEPREILYFKGYKSQLPVIEQAFEARGADARKQEVPWLLF